MRVDVDKLEALEKAATPISQSRFGDPDGNCFEACVATITGIPLDDIPHFLGDDWYAEYRAWLTGKGWNLIWWDAGTGAEPPGIAIASGPSVRGLPHSVVYRDGALAHDPHPSGAGLLELQYWLLLWPAAFPELVREVRALRGIAEAAREQRAKVLAAPWRAPWDLVEPLDKALAEYDAGGTNA